MQRTASPAPKSVAAGLSREQQEVKKRQREKAIKDFKDKAKEDAALNGFCCGCALLTVVIVAVVLVFKEWAMKCHGHATTQALDLHVAVKCDSSGIQDAAAQKKPIFFSCPLDKTSFRQWGPQNFSFAEGKSLFSVKAAWVDQEVLMYQCVETVTQHTVYHVDQKMKSTEKVERAFSYRLQWHNEHVPSEGFNGVDGRLLSADSESKAKLQEACGANFTRNPSFPSGMKTETKSAKKVTVAGGKIDISSFKEPAGIHFKMEPISLNQKEIPASFFTADGNTMVSCSVESPRVGCLRISYKQSTVASASVLAMPVKKSNSYSLQPWQEQHEPTSADKSDFCEGSVFSKVKIFSPVIGTVNDIVGEHFSSGFRDIMMHRVVFAFLAMIGLRLLAAFFPAVAANIWDDSAKFWYDVDDRASPGLVVTLFAAMMVLGCASWPCKDELRGKVGVAAAVLGCIAGLRMYLSHGWGDDKTTATTATTTTTTPLKSE